MTSLASSTQYRPQEREDLQERYGLSRRRTQGSGPSLGLMISGVAAIGLGLLAWYYFGPNLRRYIKIERL
jgi:hypothetical protein